MNKLQILNVDNGVAWVDRDGVVFGIVNAFKILDCDGLTIMNASAVTCFDFYDNYSENYDLECDVINEYLENGESCELRIFNDHVEYLDHEQLENEV